MAGGEPEIRIIGGHIWKVYQWPYAPYRGGRVYPLHDVIRCNGDPRRLQSEAATFDGKTYTKESAT